MKYRNHTAYLSISASGPLNGELENLSMKARERAFADLKYTTADVDFYEMHWKKEWGGDAKYKHHERLRNPKLREVNNALNRIGAWFASYQESEEWIGGNITIVYAGHGKNNDGSWVLEDGEISVTDLFEILNNYLINDQNSLRVSLILDSCYSGKFLVDFLHKVYAEENSIISPDYCAVACLHDEVALEEPCLGHGLYTYSFSLSSFGPYRGIDIDPERYKDPAIRLFLDPGHGCSLFTFGKQNPIRFDNGTFDTCGKHLSIFRENEPYELLTKDEIYSEFELSRFLIEDEIHRVKKSGYYIKSENLTEEGITSSDVKVGRRT
ncbi:hypothetical protein [Bacillus seohaeanensis]|uniref:Caspase domain-containing protein n=1 Tax=Bacillus seohaeanensis TaxID=284580 RepID=A0ABW5RMD4_9BACI